MKAISVWQPWASLLAAGAKCYETRSWTTDYRGCLAVHAAKSFPWDARAACRGEPLKSALRARVPGYRTPGDFPLGAIVAVGELHCIDRIGDGIDPLDVEWQERQFGDWTKGRYAWHLTDVHPLPTPIRCGGGLGVWQVPADVERAIREQLGALT